MTSLWPLIVDHVHVNGRFVLSPHFMLLYMRKIDTLDQESTISVLNLFYFQPRNEHHPQI